MTYWSVLEKVPGSKLRLTKMDDEIYEHFKKEFPDFDPAEPIKEDDMKSKAGKEKWRNFMNHYENTISDYNFGTMLRSNPKSEYDQENTIFGETLILCACVRTLEILMSIDYSGADAILRCRNRQVLTLSIRRYE